MTRCWWQSPFVRAVAVAGYLLSAPGVAHSAPPGSGDDAPDFGALAAEAAEAEELRAQTEAAAAEIRERATEEYRWVASLMNDPYPDAVPVIRAWYARYAYAEVRTLTGVRPVEVEEAPDVARWLERLTGSLPTKNDAPADEVTIEALAEAAYSAHQARIAEQEAEQARREAALQRLVERETNAAQTSYRAIEVLLDAPEPEYDSVLTAWFKHYCDRYVVTEGLSQTISVDGLSSVKRVLGYGRYYDCSRRRVTEASTGHTIDWSAQVDEAITQAKDNQRMLEAAASGVRRRAAEDFAAIQPLMSANTPEAREVLELYLRTYRDRNVRAGPRKMVVDIASVAEVERALGIESPLDDTPSSDNAMGGVVGGVIGGVEGRAPAVPGAGPRVFDHSELEVKRRSLAKFPEAARGRGFGDQRCKVWVFIDETGTPYDATVEDCPKVFHASAKETLMKWRWYPPKDGGVRIKAKTVIIVRYREQ